MRGPELEAGPEAAWVWYRDPRGSGSSTPGLSRADFHPQLPNTILLRLCHQPITRQWLAMVLFITEELNPPWKLFQQCALKYYSCIAWDLSHCGGFSHFKFLIFSLSHFPKRHCLGLIFPRPFRHLGDSFCTGFELWSSSKDFGCIYIWIYTRQIIAHRFRPHLTK